MPGMAFFPIASLRFSAISAFSRNSGQSGAVPETPESPIAKAGSGGDDFGGGALILDGEMPGDGAEQVVDAEGLGEEVIGAR